MLWWFFFFFLFFFVLFFFFNDTATTEIYTLSLHDALPIWQYKKRGAAATRSGQYKMKGHCRSKKWTVNKVGALPQREPGSIKSGGAAAARRSEEHTSELQSLTNLVCRLLLEKKNNTQLHEVTSLLTDIGQRH